MKRGDLGKALMMMGGSLAITLVAAFLLSTYGESGGQAKAATLFAAQVAMWSVFLIGYHLRFSPEKGKHQRRAKGRLLQLVRGARRIHIMPGHVLHAHWK